MRRDHGHFKAILLLAVLALAVDCSCDDDPATSDGPAVKFDGSTPPDGPAVDAAPPDAPQLQDVLAQPEGFVPSDIYATDFPPDQLVNLDGLTLPGHEYVLDGVELPVTFQDVQTYSVDLDGDGKADNALGSLLATLATVMPTLDLEAAANHGINAGESIHLFRLHTSSFTSEPAAQLLSWLGKPAACCTSTTDPVKCASEADTTCFSGSATFSPDPAKPTPNLLSGAISAGSMSFGPAPLKVRLVLKGLGTLYLRLKGAKIIGTPTSSGITAGVLGGAVDPKDINNDVIPALAGMIDVIYKDPNTASDVKSTLALFIDTNSDGTITTAELATNPLATAYIAGDVDLDKDGIKELSIGIGFTAVPASIQ